MSFIDLTADDGHRFACWHSAPRTPARATVVVLQEIFGVNTHIQSVCERLAAAGYEAFAPALFDRLQPGFQSGYSTEEVATALGFLPRLDWDALVRDTLATVAHARQAIGRPVAALGFCLGASVAYMAAQRSDALAAVVGYYGGHIVEHLSSAPQAPTLLHYGERDHTIPLANVERIRAARPDCEVHLYPAGHGFNCDERAAFEPGSAALAWDRTMGWLARHVA